MLSSPVARWREESSHILRWDEDFEPRSCQAACCWSQRKSEARERENDRKEGEREGARLVLSANCLSGGVGGRASDHLGEAGADKPALCSRRPASRVAGRQLCAANLAAMLEARAQRSSKTVFVSGAGERERAADNWGGRSLALGRIGAIGMQTAHVSARPQSAAILLLGGRGLAEWT